MMWLLDILFISWCPCLFCFLNGLDFLASLGVLPVAAVFLSLSLTGVPEVCFCGVLLFLHLVWLSSAASLLTPLLPRPGPGRFHFAGVSGGSSCSSSCSCGIMGGHILGTFWVMVGQSVKVTFSRVLWDTGGGASGSSSLSSPSSHDGDSCQALGSSSEANKLPSPWLVEAPTSGVTGSTSSS